MVWCGVVWCGVVWCGVVWCAVLRCTVKDCAVLCCDGHTMPVILFGLRDLGSPGGFSVRNSTPTLILVQARAWVQPKVRVSLQRNVTVKHIVFMTAP